MSRDGDVNQPTREFPDYARGQAEAVAAGSRPAGDPSMTGNPEPVVGARRGGRGFFWLAGILAVAVLLGFGLHNAGFWPSWRNPFAQEETDRSQPALLKSIQDLSRYVAAEGNFQVVIDLQKDRKYVPDFLLNERTLFVGAGNVEAYVDFATISDGAIVESADRKSVEIKLPAPKLGEPNLDLKNSYVFAEKRGLVNRIGDLFASDPNRQQQVYRLAEERIAAAARDSGLGARAEENTRKMLEGLLRSLGYERVTVTYLAP